MDLTPEAIRARNAVLDEVIAELNARIRRIAEANTHRGRVTNAGNEFIGAVQGDINLVEALKI